ncbi:MAG: 3-dehydroquinate synthase [Candidatus Omnitrophica bacterium]|nr:3-dehydroquinate synthase [Candidatus Omnitrophota bacterium]
MKKVRVSLGKKRSYDIVIGYKIASNYLEKLIKKLGLGNEAAVITNPAIHSIHRNAIKGFLKRLKANAATIKIPDRETSKSNRQVIKIIESIVKVDKGRGLFIIAFGGGVVGDTGGFVASIYKRGVPYIQIPTTLLAQVDSAIGGKVAIDLTSAKNLVGAFYQPRLVISDISILRSLPSRQIRSGLAEIIKYGIIKDKRLFKFLERNIKDILKLKRDPLEYVIYRSSKIKAAYVKADERDTKGIRAQLNFGHTIGHAIEAASRYSKLYSHGEAIAIGMIAASEIAVKMGLLKRPSLERITNLIKKGGLPTTISRGLDIKKIMKAQLYDKKIIHGVNRFILPVRIGKANIYEKIPKRLISEVIKNRCA